MSLVGSRSGSRRSSSGSHSRRTTPLPKCLQEAPVRVRGHHYEAGEDIQLAPLSHYRTPPTNPLLLNPTTTTSSVSSSNQSSPQRGRSNSNSHNNNMISLATTQNQNSSPQPSSPQHQQQTMMSQSSSRPSPSIPLSSSPSASAAASAGRSSAVSPQTQQQKQQSAVDVSPQAILSKKLRLYFKHYSPQQIFTVDDLVKRYCPNQEDRLWKSLERKYGKFPEQEESDETQQTKIDLLRFFRYYDPALQGKVDEIMNGFAGLNDLMWSSLEIKYGSKDIAMEATAGLAKKIKQHQDALAAKKKEQEQEKEKQLKSPSNTSIISGGATTSGSALVSPTLSAASPITSSMQQQQQQSATNMSLNFNSPSSQQLQQQNNSFVDPLMEAFMKPMDLQSRLKRFFTKVDPEKIPKIQELVSVYGESNEEELLRMLEALYGEAPERDDIDDDFHNNNNDETTSAGTEQQQQQKRSHQDIAAQTFARKQKLSREPLSPVDAERWMRSFCSRYAPERTNEVELIVARFKGKETELREAMESMFSSVPVPRQGLTAAEERELQKKKEFEEKTKNFRARLTRFFEAYDRPKLSQLDHYAENFFQFEDQLFENLVKKYGDEPATGVVYESYKQKIIAIYQKHNPNNISEVDALLKRHAGSEEHLLGMLVSKYSVTNEFLAKITSSSFAASAAASPNQQKQQEEEEEQLLRQQQEQQEQEREQQIRQQQIYQQLVDFFSYYEPAQLNGGNNIERLMRVYREKENAMWNVLEREYGTAPHFMSPAQKQRMNQVLENYKNSNSFSPSPARSAAAKLTRTTTTTTSTGSMSSTSATFGNNNNSNNNSSSNFGTNNNNSNNKSSSSLQASATLGNLPPLEQQQEEDPAAAQQAKYHQEQIFALMSTGAKKRLMNWLAFYDPPRVRDITRIFSVFAGREKEMWEMMEKRFGSEPTSGNVKSKKSLETSARILRGICDRFYSHYDPSRAFEVDALAEQFLGAEDECKEYLIKKFGPEPTYNILAADMRKRLILYFKHYDPTQILNVDVIAEAYIGMEDQLFELLAQQYGPEPQILPSDKSRFKRRLLRYLNQYPQARQVIGEDIYAVVREYEDWEDEYFESQLVPHFGYEPADEEAEAQKQAVIEQQELAKTTLAQRLKDFFSTYDDDQLANVSVLVDSYHEQPDELFKMLCDAYGVEYGVNTPGVYLNPESSTVLFGSDSGGGNSGLFGGQFDNEEGVLVSSPSASSMSARDKLISLYSKNDPGKLDRVDAILHKYENRTPELFEMLGEKYPTESDQCRQWAREEEELMKMVFRDEDSDNSGISEPRTPEPESGVDPSSWNRVKRIYQKYDPKNMKMAEVLLKKYGAGREEELIAALVDKYGPEPSQTEELDESSFKKKKKQKLQQNRPAPLQPISSVPSSPTAPPPQPTKTPVAKSQNYRERAYRVFEKYDPQKLEDPTYFPRLLKRFSEHLEDMMPYLEEIYDLKPGTTEKITRGEEFAEAYKLGLQMATYAENVERPSDFDVRGRLLRLYQQYDPTRIYDMDIKLWEHEGEEEQFLQQEVQELGEEPVGEVQVRYRLLKFYQAYNPEKIGEVDTVLTKFKGRETHMFKLFLMKYGPEPPDVVPREPPSTQEIDYKQSIRQRVVAIYQRYAPDKLNTVDDVLEKYNGQEENLLQQLESKYKLQYEDLITPTEQQKASSYKDRLVAIYRRFAPEKLSNIDDILRRYRGDEENLFDQLELKYGNLEEAEKASVEAKSADGDENPDAENTNAAVPNVSVAPNNNASAAAAASSS